MCICRAGVCRRVVSEGSLKRVGSECPPYADLLLTVMLIKQHQKGCLNIISDSLNIGFRQKDVSEFAFDVVNQIFGFFFRFIN